MTATIDAPDAPDAPPAGPAPAPAEAPRRGSLARALALMLVVGAALAALIVVVVDASDEPTIDPYEVTVAPDTGAGLASGEVDDVVPAVIRLEPGQQLVLRNDDWQPHTLGDLTAERGDRVQISYPSEGRHITATSLRGDGRLTILVEDTGS